MSYNVDTFKVKKLNSLKIPVASLFKHPRSDWHPKVIEGEVTRFEIFNETSAVSGHVSDGVISVTEIKCSGEGSGTSMDWVIEPALKDSTGEFIASCVWEGGEKINILEVKDGDVTWTDLDIWPTIASACSP